MRAAWLIVFVCTTAAADDGWRYRSRADGHRMTNDKIDVPPEPPLAAFATAGTFYVITVAATPRCEAWTVDPAAKTFTGPTATLALASEGAYLQLGSGCGAWVNVSETADGVDLDGSTWFRDRSACMQAIAKHRPVATDLSGCVARSSPIEGPQIRAKLDRVLVRGGTLFAVIDDSTDTKPEAPRCEPVRVDGGEFHHALTSTDLDDRPIHGETVWQFHYTAGDDDFTVTDGATHWSNGTGFGLLCAHHQHIELGPEWVDLGERYYFSAATCRAAMTRERERASWFARPEPRHAHGVGFGGC